MHVSVKAHRMLANDHNSNSSQGWNVPQVICSHTTLREMIRRDNFPYAYEITRGKRHFAMSEVQAWLHKKMESQQKGGMQ